MFNPGFLGKRFTAPERRLGERFSEVAKVDGFIAVFRDS